MGCVVAIAVQRWRSQLLLLGFVYVVAGIDSIA